MKYVKKLVLCLCVSMIVVISFVEPVSAVDFDEYGRPIWSDEELQQFGAVFEEDGFSYYFPSGTYHPDDIYAINPLLITEPYNSKFDMYKLPWETFPSVVQDIMYMNLDGYAFSDIDLTKYIIPFVVMIVTDTAVEIYAGNNLGLGMRDDNGRLCICSVPYHNGIYDVVNVKCYYAKYRLSDYSVVTDWKLLTPYAWGDKGFVNYYMRFPLTDYEYDVYIYGGCGSTYADYSRISIPLTDTVSATFYQDGGIGYTSGRYFPGQENFAICWKYFYPPTIQELEAIRQQEINDALNQTGTQEFTTLEGQDKLDDFNAIGDDVTSIFAPSDFDLDVDGAIDSFEAFDFVWGIFDNIIKADEAVFSFFICALALGVVILILNR